MFNIRTQLARALRTQQVRSFHERAPQRKWVQQYDQEIIDKYPRVLQVIRGELQKADLNTTERSAYFVATYKTGLSGAKRIRQRERRLNFEAKVNGLVDSWKQAEFLQRKENMRKSIVAKGKATKLSTYKENINAPKFQMQFTATRYD